MALKTKAISFLWGFSEALFFFFVPDIWLTKLALTNLKDALINSLYALLGALCGGTILYVLGSFIFDTILHFLTHIPAISQNMVDTAGAQMQDNNPAKAIMKAGFTGVPFKIYAAWSGHLQLPFLIFLTVGAIARLARFASLILITYGIKTLLSPHITIQKIHALHLIFWIIFYLFYFLKVGL